MEIIRLLETPYWRVDYHQNSKILWAEWQEIAFDMGEVLFKQHLIKFIEFFDKYEILGFLVDSRKGHFITSVEMQEWHDIEIAPVYLQHKIQKIAFLMPDNIYAELALEQTFKEEGHLN
jgi:hypothetical protein